MLALPTRYPLPRMPGAALVYFESRKRGLVTSQNPESFLRKISLVLINNLLIEVCYI